MSQQAIFNWLLRYGTATNTPSTWTVLLNVRIIDADGWTDKPFTEPINLIEFVQRAARSTIM